MFKSGFVSVIGRTNVGKSTFINNFFSQKLLIMSDKPQTTRNKIRAVYTDDDCQIIFLDTPGIHKPKSKLSESLNKSSSESYKEVELIIFMTDDCKDIGKGDKLILDGLKNIKNTPIVVVLNKLDLFDKEDYVKIIDRYNKEYPFIKEVIGVSSIKGFNQDLIKDDIVKYFDQGPKYFPDGMITDMPQNFIVAEIIREKMLHYLNEEVPHGVAVVIEKIEKRKNSDIIDIEALIICERDSHKGIIIGKEGRKLKGIGKTAREELEVIFGNKVNLKTWVKVKKNWRDREDYIRRLGY